MPRKCSIAKREKDFADFVSVVTNGGSLVYTSCSIGHATCQSPIGSYHWGNRAEYVEGGIC